MRWVINPIDITVTSIGEPLPGGGTAARLYRARVPRVFTLGFQHSSWATSGVNLGQENDWCVSLIKATDFSAIDADPEIINAVGIDLEPGDGGLAESPNTLRWDQARKDRFRQVFTDKGADTADLTDNSPLWAWLERLGDLLESPDMRQGQRRVFVHPETRLSVVLNDASPASQRETFGEKILGFRPKTTRHR